MLLLVGALALVPSVLIANASPEKEDKYVFKGDQVFDRILTKAKSEGWSKLPLNQRMGKIATELLGTPYVAYTLELDENKEFCSINLDGLDCVTFFESTLNFGRILKQKNPTKEAFLHAVQQTRYRQGKLGDYTSRLHYTTDWFYDNVRKGYVKDITQDLPGAEIFTQKVGFMSTHPASYRQLKANPDLIPVIKKQEETINARTRYYLPLEKIADAEKLLQTGDIIGICTTQPGIDIAHTGLVFKDEQGVVHFMDASSAKSKMKVTLETRLSEAVRGSRLTTGIIVARPTGK